MKNRTLAYTTGGLSQAERFPASLDPDFFHIEERDTNDFLQYLLYFSKKLNYYNLNNQVDGDWEDFFLSDINIVVRLLAKFDIGTVIRQYDGLKNKLSREKSDKGLVIALQGLFQFSYEFLLFQVKLHSKFSAIPKDEIGVMEFRRVVHEYDRYDDELMLLNAWLAYAKRHFGEELKVDFDSRDAVYVQSRGAKENEADLFSEIENRKDRILSGLKSFDGLFAKLRSKYYRLQEAAEVFVHKRNELGALYHPHTGLLMTFLELYKLVKKDINAVTKKHLDYYYGTILQLERKKAQPDKVYLLVDIHPSQPKLVIDRGEELIIDKPDVTENNIFSLDADTVFTRAGVKKIKTLYVSENVKLSAKTDTQNNIYEQQVFIAENPVNLPADFIEQNPQLHSWPLLGEDQEDISQDQMTMQPADIGFVLASPLLYAKDGKRTFEIKLYLAKNSFNALKQYAYDYADVSDIYSNVIMHNMLKEAFYLEVTGDEGWLSIDKYNISSDIGEKADQSINVHFVLSASQPPTAIYDAAIHGSGYNTGLPVLRMKINNSAFYNPYTFLKNIILDRITIKLDVEESRQVKLRNNIGEISIVNPFQLFGPQPAVGSYLDIKNSNIFNKYTIDFSVTLHWFDLPRDKGGFETYYSAYPGYIKNESFKVSLSSLTEGRYYPEPEGRQMYNLFAKKDAAGEKNYLSDTTVVEDIDFLRVRFDNEQSMYREAEPETNFKEGAIRFELTAPQDAFGHKIFTSLFPEVVMHNGKRFVKKRELPNQPYIPVLKAVSVNYTLEHSESLSGVYQENQAAGNLLIWHDHPFGFKKVYPGKNTAAFSLIPSFSHQSNIFIGLEDAMPGELISLLFRFEETNFSSFNYSHEDVQWSILHDNEWVPIPRADVLQDGTASFIKTGIVTLRLPDYHGKNNSVLDPSLFWIKASCNCRGDIRSRTLAVWAQAASATRTLSNEASLTADDLKLPAGTFTQFRNKNPKILSVAQPFSSFDGRAGETEQQYYIRVSEQLRHKNRAITATDISQLILDSFPEILKVKCFETEVDGKAIMPGVDLLVVVIQKRHTGKDMHEYPKVDLSKLFTIKQFLSNLVSPFTKVEVANPIYEKLKVVCSVVFNINSNGTSAAKQTRSQESNGILLQRLNIDLKQWISPWLYNPELSINAEGKIYVSEILNFIKRCSYVSYVTGFSVLHFYQEYDSKTGEFYERMLDTAVEKMEFLTASMPNTLLVSASEHAITVLDKPSYVEPSKTGISGMMIGRELLVSDPDLAKNTGSTRAWRDDEDEDEEYNFYFKNINS